MNTHRWQLIIFLAGALLLIFAAAGVISTYTRAQADFADQLAVRLAEHGVPVVSIGVTSRLPFAVEINPQSQTTGDTLEIADVQHMSLAQREASLAYRAGTRLDSVRVNVLNAQGEAIFGIQDFLHPENPSQQLAAPLQPALSDREMEALVREQLGLQDQPGIVVERMEVSPMDTPGGQGQKLELVVRAVDFSERNGSISNLIGAFRGFLPVWEGPTSPLIYGHLQILNQDGKIALDLVLDMETRSERTSAEMGDLNWLVEESSPGPLRTVGPQLPPVEAYP